MFCSDLLLLIVAIGNAGDAQLTALMKLAMYYSHASCGLLRFSARTVLLLCGTFRPFSTHKLPMSFWNDTCPCCGIFF